MKGIVYLVGAGPGDTGLITVKGLEAIRKADVILYDNLVNESLLEEARDDAQVMYVGKTAGHPHRRQDTINELLKAHAAQGKVVVRLKGGDPFVFGRGGEEALDLRKDNIAFEIVPGVTSAVAVPAYAGIPLTQRQISSSVAFVAGHEAPTKGAKAVDWTRLATAVDTLVILMGLSQLEKIVDKLLSAGKKADTPVALIRQGTRRGQQTITGRLDEIAGRVRSAHFEPPAIIIVGDVVTLREELSWFEARPLFGRKIVVARRADEARSLCRALEEAGAEVFDARSEEPVPARDGTHFDESVRKLKEYDWLIFADAAGVEQFMRHLFSLGKDARELAGCKLCALGPLAAAGLASFGLRADCSQASSVNDALNYHLSSGELLARRKLLLVCSHEAPDILACELEACGSRVDSVLTPRAPSSARADGVRDALHGNLLRELSAGRIDLVTFASPSAVLSFARSVGGVLQQLMRGATIACVGAETAAAVRNLEVDARIISESTTVDGLIESVLDSCRREI